MLIPRRNVGMPARDPEGAPSPNRWFLRPGATVVLLTVVALLAGTARFSHFADATTSVQSPPSGLVAADYMSTKSGSVTRASALAQARQFDVIIAYATTYARYVDEMRAQNPDLVLLAYENGSFIDTGTDPRGVRYPRSWYSMNCAGHKLRSKGFGAWLMNPTLGGGWRDNRISTARDLLSSSGYDGIFLDMMGPAPTVGHYVWDAVTHADSSPVRPGSKPCAKYSAAEWMKLTGQIAQSIATRTGKPVWGNGLGNGPSFYSAGGASTSALQQYTAGGMAEAFVRSQADPVKTYRSEREWKQDIDMLVSSGAKHEQVLAITKLWVNASPAQAKRWLQYSLASFLLGSNRYTFFSFRDDRALSANESLYGVKLGAPLGQYSQNAGVYQRAFQNGRVLVNPGSRSVDVKLGGSLRTVAGQVVTAVTLQPHTGMILTRG